MIRVLILTVLTLCACSTTVQEAPRAPVPTTADSPQLARVWQRPAWSYPMVAQVVEMPHRAVPQPPPGAREQCSSWYLRWLEEQPSDEGEWISPLEAERQRCNDHLAQLSGIAEDDPAPLAQETH